MQQAKRTDTALGAHAKPDRKLNPPFSRRLRLWTVYSLSFCALFLIIWGPMFLSGKELIWAVDGLVQHYPFLAYEGRWLREIVSSIAAGSPTVPMWDPAMGYGADIFTTIGAYVGDPLNLLSVFFDERGCEALFCVLMVVRIYLAGLAFIGYISSRGYDAYSTLLGAVSYTFCGWTSIVFNHSFFVYPLIFFPLLLWGADRVIKKRRPELFTLSVAMLFLTYFYFGYMACLALVPYCLYRVRQHEGSWSPVAIIKWALRYLLLLAVGLAMAAITLMPIVHVVLGADRLGLERSTPLLYPLWTYSALLAGVGGIVNLNKDTYWGVSAVCLLAVAVLFSRKGDRHLKVALIALAIGVLLPVFGKVMNGFSYYANRWIWIFIAFLVYLQVRYTHRMLSPTNRTALIMCVAGGAVIACSLKTWSYSNHVIFPVAAATVAIAICYAVFAARRSSKGMRSSKTLFAAVTISCVVLANLGFWYLGWSQGMGRQVEELDTGAGYTAHFGDTATSIMDDVPDVGQWRYDIGVMVPRTQNSDTARGLRSANFYSSIYNNGVDQFNTALGITSDILNHRILELRGRSALEAFFGMRYFVAPIGQEAYLPYGCSSTPIKTKTLGDITYGLYENELALPVARLYPDDTISRTAFMDMGLSERQLSLLSTVTMDEDAETDDVTTTSSARELPFELISTDPDVDAAADGTRFTVRKAGVQITLRFDALQNSETNVELRNLNFSPYLPHEEEPSGLIAELKHAIGALFPNDPDEYSMEFRTSDGVYDYVYGYTPDSHLYGGKHDWLVNLGYSATGKTEATITFTQPGVYTLDSLRVTAFDVDTLRDAKVELTKSKVRAVAGTNSYVFEADAAEAGRLLAIVPYSDGWSAKLDGEAVDIRKSDIAFMSFEMPQGKHRVELRYETPLFRLGAIVSAAGWTAFAALSYFAARRHGHRGTD